MLIVFARRMREWMTTWARGGSVTPHGNYMQLKPRQSTVTAAAHALVTVHVSHYRILCARVTHRLLQLTAQSHPLGGELLPVGTLKR